jgi:SAM-dependent methyltransferase
VAILTGVTAPREALHRGRSRTPIDDGGREVDRCAACGADALAAHFEVRGELGADGLIPTTKQFGTALSDVIRCTRCGHMQLDRFPGEGELAREYADAASDDYVDEEPGQRESARRVLERIERYVRPGRLLDLGCWVGFLMSEANARRWRSVGIEPSGFASSHARDRLGLDVRTDDLFTAELPEHAFDAVLLGDVLEHLTRTGEALERVATLLAPGGVLVLLLPDAGSRVARLLGRRWWSVIPTHIHYFTRESAAVMLARHGFRVRYVGTDPKAFTVRYYLNKTSGYSPALSRLLIRGAETLGCADRMWTPDFRDRMIVIATRDEAAGAGPA